MGLGGLSSKASGFSSGVLGAFLGFGAFLGGPQGLLSPIPMPL